MICATIYGYVYGMAAAYCCNRGMNNVHDRSSIKERLGQRKVISESIVLYSTFQ